MTNNTTKKAESLKTWPVKLYVESINKDAGCSGTVFTTPSPLSEEYIRADTVHKLQLEAIHKTIEECSLVNFSQAEIEAIKRLDEVFQDGEGYDVDKDMMKNLAHLGVIRHIGAARYEFTVIGNQILNRLLYIGGFNPEEILKGLTP